MPEKSREMGSSESNNGIVGLYLASQTAADDPGYLDALQQAVGLNLLILSGGYTLSPDVQQMNPLKAERQGPGFSWEVEGSTLERAIDNAHKRGIQVWLLMGCWQIGAEQHPDLCAQDMWGNRLTDYPLYPYCSEQRSLTFCPSDEDINTFYEAAYADVIRQYPLDGIDITHARYTSPAFWPSMFSCACERCRRRAQCLGFDWERMHDHSLTAIDSLKSVDSTTLQRFTGPGVGIGDLVHSVTGREGVLDWFNFRAEVISHNIKRFHDAVHQATDRSVVFGVDNFPPSVALFAGHRYHDFMSVCDYTSPLLSHPSYFVLAVIQSWSHTLRTWIPDLSEVDALHTIYGLLGFDKLRLPGKIDHLGNGLPESEPDVPGLEELVHFDLVKARQHNTGEVPSYPVLMGGLWSRGTVQRLTEAARALGHEGVIYQRSEAITSYSPRA
jgi:hypothetical protein